MSSFKVSNVHQRSIWKFFLCFFLCLETKASPTPFPDLAIGPYESLQNIFIKSVRSQAIHLDASDNYGEVTSQGYVLASIGELLWASRNHDLSFRQELIDIALEEIAELIDAKDMTITGSSYGLEYQFDAFGDTSINPPFTAYSWQSGIVAYGAAKIARALLAYKHPEAGRIFSFAEELVSHWHSFFTPTHDGGYFWYSTQAVDNKAVHNANVLLGMASQILKEVSSSFHPIIDPSLIAKFLWNRMSGNPTKGYVWNYIDDGYPKDKRVPEDLSHGSITLLFMSFAGERGWWSSSQMHGVSNTLLKNIWTGHPSHLVGRIDGTRVNTSAEVKWSRVAPIGFASHGNSKGGNPAVFDYARSILFSSYLTRYKRPFDNAAVDAIRLFSISLMLSRRPDAFQEGSKWQTIAGGLHDDEIPSDLEGGIRFYTVDWESPKDHLFYHLELPGRRAEKYGANILVDYSDSPDEGLVISLTYQSTEAGEIQQWDGTRYHTVAVLPASSTDGINRWMRTSFLLNKDIEFDYQPSVPGKNILFQFTSEPVLSRLEATPF